MLTASQLHFTLRSYSVCSYVGILPLWIDVKNCRIQMQNEFWWRFLWTFQFGWMVLRGCLGFWRAWDALVLDSHGSESFVYFPVLVASVISNLVGTHSAYSAFSRGPEVLITIFNSLLRGSLNRTKTTWKNITLQEMAALVSPWNAPIMMVMYGVIVFTYPTAPFSLNLFLPGYLRTDLTLAIIVCIEMIYCGFLTATLMFICTIMLLFFQKCAEDGRYLVAKAKTL